MAGAIGEKSYGGGTDGPPGSGRLGVLGAAGSAGYSSVVCPGPHRPDRAWFNGRAMDGGAVQTVQCECGAQCQKVMLGASMRCPGAGKKRVDVCVCGCVVW